MLRMAGRKQKLIIGGLRRLLNGTARMSRRQAGALGYYVLTKPRRVPDDPQSDRHLREAQQYCVDFEGVDLHCYHWPGEGPSVLLLHGWESSTGRWHAFLEPLRRAGYSIYAFDAPAQGRSGGKRFNAFLYACALRDYLEHHSFAPDYWIAHSAGGMAAILYLTEFSIEYEPQQLVSMAVPGYLQDFIDKFCEVVGVHDRVKRGIDDQFERKLKRRFAEVSFVEYVKEMRIPGLIVHDEEDELSSAGGARAMHANWAGSSLLITRGYGHSLTGELVPNHILDYLRHCRSSR